MQQAITQPQQPSLQVVGGTAVEQPVSDPFDYQRLPKPLCQPELPSPPYPVEALGRLEQAATKAIEELIQAPAAICAQSVLAACAYTTQQQTDVRMPTGLTRPVSLYLLSVGESGERKSAVDDLASKPLVEHQQERQKGQKALMKAYLDAKKRGDDTAEPPLNPLCLVQEPTFEGLCKLLAEGGPNIALMSDEGGSFLNSHAMSEDNKIRTATGLSSLWDGKALSRPRANQAAEALYGKRLGIHLLVQPAIAGFLMSDASMRDQGFLSRVLISKPDSSQGKRFWREPSQSAISTLREYSSYLKRLLAEPMPLEKGERNILELPALSFDQNAKRAFISFYNDIEKEMGGYGKFAAISGLANKAPEHAARIAAVQGYVNNPGAREIGEETFDRAVTLVRYYLDEALRLVTMAPVNADMVMAQKLFTWICGRGKAYVHLAEVYQFGPAEIRTKTLAMKIIGILEAHDCVIRLPSGTMVGGVARRDAFRLNFPGLPQC
jgi:hypothetical protein